MKFTQGSIYTTYYSSCTVYMVTPFHIGRCLSIIYIYVNWTRGRGYFVKISSGMTKIVK